MIRLLAALTVGVVCIAYSQAFADGSGRGTKGQSEFRRSPRGGSWRDGSGRGTAGGCEGFRIITVDAGCTPKGAPCNCPGGLFPNCPTSCITTGCNIKIKVLNENGPVVEGKSSTLVCTSNWYMTGTCAGTPATCWIVACPSGGCFGTAGPFFCAGPTTPMITGCN